VRGIEVNDNTLAISVMKDVCIGGPGHYLGHDQTIGLMQTEYVYPSVSDRSSPKEWEELGKPVLVEEARKRKEEILAEFHPEHISSDLDQLLRSRYDIRLA
jgi:trimethylamine--corrinoid protein Co-methyltransferase